MKNNFDDFLSAASFDDLDDLHATDEREHYKKGGLKKLVNKVKGKLAARKARRNPKADSYSDADVAKLSAEKNNHKATKLNKSKETVPQKKKAASRVGTRIKLPEKKTESKAKVIKMKKTIKKVPTKRGTGNTYKATWDADKGGVKGKYKDYAAFETAAKAWNSKNDAKKSKSTAKPKVKAKVKKKDPKLALDAKRGKVTKKEMTKQFPMGFGSKS